MWFRSSLYFLSILAVISFAPIPKIAAATLNLAAEPIQIFATTQQDLDGDGAPDVTVIECAFATEHDQVLVHDINGDMPWGTHWQDVTDFSDDIWIFDAGADGTAQLIVVFAMEGEQHTALVYDDLDGDSQVAYRMEGNQILIEESDYWHVKVVSSRPWTQPGGLFSTKVTFQIDGYDGLQYGAEALAGLQGQGVDGVADWQVEIDDQDGDGINDYAVYWAISPAIVEHRTGNLGNKSIIYGQVTGSVPTPYAEPVFWPLLINGGDSGAGGRYFDNPPAMIVDWQAGVIVRLGILGYPIETGYHIFNNLPLEKHKTNLANWENPMAYYDMANDQDGWPELQFRFNVKVPHDPFFPSGRLGTEETPNLEVHVSWDQNNDNAWDYKLSLSSNDNIDTIMEFPDFAITSVPHAEVVSWVRDRTWNMATFTQDYQSSRDSEGMFAKGWQVSRGWDNGEYLPSHVPDDYMTGFSDRLPIEYYRDIQENMRGEYSFQYFNTPQIYLSALDRQLHLSGAQAGVWNLGDGHRLRYANRDGDAYLDEWQEDRDGEVVQQLNYDRKVFVQSGNSEVRVKQVDIDPALLETQPPGNYEEWQRLDEQLKANQLPVSPDDFAGMLGQLPGTEMLISEATVRDYRVTPLGFRFILELRPGFSAIPDQEILIPLPEAPGTYVVEYNGAAWSVQPSTPPSLRISDIGLDTQAGSSQAQQWTTLQTLLHNDGLEDMHDLVVCATIDDAVGRRVVMTDTLDLLPGAGDRLLAWNWAPDAAGTWQVELAANCIGSADGGSGGQVLGATTVEVAERPKPSMAWLVSLGGEISGAIVLFLGATVAIAGLAAALWMKRSIP